jgi:hypothetical protein
MGQSDMSHRQGAAQNDSKNRVISRAFGARAAPTIALAV